MSTTTDALSGYNSYRDYLNDLKYADSSDSTTKRTDTANKTTTWNAVFDEDGQNALDMDGFLKIMVTQLTNQDFLNPVDDTQFVTQMAQFSMMQSMSDLQSNFKNNYMLSLVGQTVTCAKFNVSGDLVKKTGVVERIILAENDYSIYVDGEKFSLSQIMELGASKTDTSNKTDTDNKVDGSDKTDETDKTEGADKTEDADKTDETDKTPETPIKTYTYEEMVKWAQALEAEKQKAAAEKAEREAAETILDTVSGALDKNEI